VVNSNATELLGVTFLFPLHLPIRLMSSARESNMNSPPIASCRTIAAG
jgi:hypothetical protein